MTSLSNLLGLFLQPFRTLTLPPPTTFTNKTILITGSNTGIGLAAATHFIRLNASKVILAVRNPTKGEAAKEKIEAETGRTGVVEVWGLDLERWESVEGCLERVKEMVRGEGGRLDVAVMNAGVAKKGWEVSDGGWECQVQVNVLSTALLARGLLPLMVESSKKIGGAEEEGGWKPHLMILTSDAHMDCAFEERKLGEKENILSALNDRERWEKASSNPVERYAVTKLLDIYIGLSLAQLTPNTTTAPDSFSSPNVIVNLVAPGFCKSELLSREEGAPLMLRFMQWLTARSTMEGAKTIVDAAVRGEESHGRYLDHQKVARMGRLVMSEEGVRVREKVWGEILEVLEGVVREGSV
ncbi:MAG: hypothetical protein M1834_002127 [Cirrosporium novae-zelandiae]|nr:MAG: hypothetical protein M1834_002127 [Cirrosporium novae-zelandiae]